MALMTKSSWPPNPFHFPPAGVLDSSFSTSCRPPGHLTSATHDQLGSVVCHLRDCPKLATQIGSHWHEIQRPPPLQLRATDAPVEHRTELAPAVSPTAHRQRDSSSCTRKSVVVVASAQTFVLSMQFCAPQRRAILPVQVAYG